MIKRIVSFGLLFIIFQNCFSQIPSPEQFLGYKIGTRFTPHWKIVDYFKTVAAAAPSLVKLQEYGLTHEGRPLMVAFISSQSNISNLENIRVNNLRLAHIFDNKSGKASNALLLSG